MDREGPRPTSPKAIAADPDDPGTKTQRSYSGNHGSGLARRKGQVHRPARRGHAELVPQEGRGYQTRINAVLRGF